MMSDICIPIPKSKLTRTANVEVKLEGEPHRFSFRLESFPWLLPGGDSAHTEARFRSFQNSINSYEKDWELVQIYNPPPKADFIQVLFRHKAD